VPTLAIEATPWLACAEHEVVGGAVGDQVGKDVVEDEDEEQRQDHQHRVRQLLSPERLGLILKAHQLVRVTLASGGRLPRQAKWTPRAS
jgi:hypothetical protein